jgi:hypothetical protein
MNNHSISKEHVVNYFFKQVVASSGYVGFSNSNHSGAVQGGSRASWLEPERTRRESWDQCRRSQSI